jgi:hypothetical protein
LSIKINLNLRMKTKSVLVVGKVGGGKDGEEEKTRGLEG